MDWPTAIGLAAACGTTVGFVPQVVKAWRTGSTRDLSFLMIFILASGVGLWIVYGIMRSDGVIIVANVITLSLVLTLLTLKLRSP